MSTTATPRGVLFDLDETLVDHRGAVDEAVVAWAAEVGVVDDPALVRARWEELEVRWHAAYQARRTTFAEQRRARVRAFLPHLDLRDDAAADQVFAGFHARYERSWRAFRDARPALDRARAAGLRVGVLTNGAGPHQRAKLRRTGLGDLPVFASSELPAPKPDPRAFAAACTALGVAPDACTMVGDSLAADVAGALDAGLDAVLLDRHDLLAARLRTTAAGRGTRVRRVRSLAELTFA